MLTAKEGRIEMVSSTSFIPVWLKIGNNDHSFIWLVEIASLCCNIDCDGIFFIIYAIFLMENKL
jgi:hypothetical protein